MRWRIKQTREPRHDETRSRYVFAWRRTRVGDVIVWLESYVVYERYFQPLNGPGWWSEIRRELMTYYF